MCEDCIEAASHAWKQRNNLSIPFQMHTHHHFMTQFEWDGYLVYSHMYLRTARG